MARTLSLLMYKTIVITLKNARLRQEAMRQQLTAMGMDFRFFDATNGYELSEFPEQYDRVKRLLYFGFDMKPGEIGCFISHRQVWQYAAQTKKTILVLEDDAQLSTDLGQALDFVLHTSHEWDMVRLCGARTKPNIRYEFARQGRFTLAEELKDPALSTGYLLRPSGAIKLIEASRHFFIPVDNFMELRHSNHLRTLSVLPYPLTSMTMASTIGDRKLPLKTKSFRVRRMVFRSIRDLTKAAWITWRCMRHAFNGRWPTYRKSS